MGTVRHYNTRKSVLVTNLLPKTDSEVLTVYADEGIFAVPPSTQVEVVTRFPVQVRNESAAPIPCFLTEIYYALVIGYMPGTLGADPPPEDWPTQDIPAIEGRVLFKSDYLLNRTSLYPYNDVTRVQAVAWKTLLDQQYAAAVTADRSWYDPHPILCWSYIDPGFTSGMSFLAKVNSGHLVWGDDDPGPSDFGPSWWQLAYAVLVPLP